MTSLAALIEKLRGLKGPDREVDAEIAALVYGATISCGNLIHIAFLEAKMEMKK